MRRTLLSCVLLFALAVPSRSQAAVHSLADGPHVLWDGPRARILEIRNQDQLGERRAQAPIKLELRGMAATALTLRGQPYRPAPAALPDPGRILAISDIHGRFDAMLVLLQAQRVVDGKLRWTFGKGHLVIAGDIFDRGPQVTEILWFLRALEDSARKAGGAVHLVLGNHETMVMGGDLRYLHSKYVRRPDGLPPLVELYGPASELGRWMRSRPALLRLGPFLFAHGGPGPALLDQGFDLSKTNAAVRMALGKTPKQREDEAAFILGSDGPLWYRGLVPGASELDADDAFVTRALKAFGVKSLVIGHTTMEVLTPLHGGRVYAIDAGIMSGRPGEAWIWDKGRVWRGTADGKRAPL